MNKLLTLLIGSIVALAPTSVKAQDIFPTAIKFGSLQLAHYREYGRFFIASNLFNKEQRSLMYKPK